MMTESTAETARQTARHNSCHTPRVTFVQPVTGFQVASVHSIVDLSPMLIIRGMVWPNLVRLLDWNGSLHHCYRGPGLDLTACYRHSSLVMTIPPTPLIGTAHQGGFTIL